ncbi:MAG: RNA methyltransferase [Ignavibacteriae bacterium]|nr:RNA methyltransferase [Ignavibacteriota bacterium]
MRLTKSEIKYLRSLTQKKYREQERKFLLEGWRPLAEAVGSDFVVEMIAVSTAHRNPEENKTLANARKKSIPVKGISEKELTQISSTVHSQGVVAVVRQHEYSIENVLDGKPSLVVALDAVSDPGNLGSIIRSCDWFGVDTVLLSKGNVELYNEKVLRSTAGSIFHLPMVEDVDLKSALAQFRRAGYFVATLSGDGKENYTNGSLKKPAVLVFGSEAHGVSEDVRAASDVVLSIPRYGSAESLNVGVACGIVLAHMRNI